MRSWIKILIGLVSGIIIGFILGPRASIFAIFGKIFINLLTMLVVIIVFSSLVVGICHIKEPKKLGRIGRRTFGFYVISALIAISIAILIAYIIRPGVGISFDSLAISYTPGEIKTLSDFFLSLIPSNPFAAFAEGNIMQIIVFAIFLAIAIVFTREKSAPLLTFLESLAHTMHTLTHFVMLLAPYGIFALIASTVGSMGLQIVLLLLKFLACNYIACFIQLFFVFGIALRYITKMKVIPFFKGMKDAIVVAFSTCSSSATLPVSLECAQKHLGISENISGFVISLGSTMNMNGAAIGQAISAIFVAQVYGIPLGSLKIAILVIISFFSSVGAAGISGTGLIMLTLVLSVMGLPLEGIGLVAGVDRLREMVSTVVNVLGDGVAAIFVAKKEKEIDETVYNRATWLDSNI